MANILFRGTVAPTQPVAVSGGSAAKGTPLTNDEGDWNYKALNDDIQTRAPIANPAFTGVTTVQYNIRSALAAFNQYTATINDSVTSTGCEIGEYLCNAISQNATIKVEVVVRNGITEATSTARVSIRSNILPSVDATIHQQRDATDTLGVTVEAWRDASTGKIVLFAVPTETVQNVSFKIDVFERTTTNLFVLTTTNVAKNTTGLTQITQTDAASFFPGVVNATSFTGALTGNASTATLSAKATVLETARTINGVYFNGSANITIADATKAPLNGSGATGTWPINVTGTSANVSGTVAVANGGTGQTSHLAIVNASISARWVHIDTNYSVQSGGEYSLWGALTFTVTLPPSPNVGESIIFHNGWNNWNTGTVTIARGNATHTINGLAENVLVDSNATRKLTFTYIATNIWVVSAG